MGTLRYRGGEQSADCNKESGEKPVEQDSADTGETERIVIEMGADEGAPISYSEDEDNDTSQGRRHRRRGTWSNLPYMHRVTLSFALIAVMTALVAIGVLSFVWDQHFRSYTQDNMQALADQTADNIEAVYKETGTLYSPQVFAMARYSESLNSGVGVAIVDNRGGNVVYDSSDVLANEDNGAEGPGAGEGVNPFPSDAPLGLSQHGSQFASAPITVDGVAIGSVRVWVYGSETLIRQTDQQFRDSSYRAMVFASLLSVALATCIGWLFARNLVSPVNTVARTAREIKEGDLSARTGLHGDDEIARLGETFDAMAEAVEKDRELERRLTTDVAHELRTPLMAIQSTVEAMVDGVFEADEERLETVNSEVQRLSRLVDAILKLSRLENRSTPMKKEVVDVGELVDGIVATHEAFVIDSGLRFESDLEQGVYVLGDADMIRQATANLISNAVRYTPEGGCITVKVSKGDLMASIVVADTGIGLSPEETKMVFSRFWRADAGRQRESGGLGIGLSVVKEIVDRHNGWVQVKGQKGVGATFIIHIPLYQGEDKRKGLRQKNPIAPSWTGGK
ncbi:HAMP domain-containing sensor histidine kinase [Adlercreutzia sp. ZJ138]|uniref:sensor histidine kinase n=1 Tax=Adlercreutzia sp. ZJ138 TaxID=2709405 RepID=UPI001F1562CD|nr:HAMP domain-containing sensor histidine kinase [Adlercreutzia sp. ZJ138]